MRVSSVHIRVFSHATEDEEKVKSLFSKLVSPEYLKKHPPVLQRVKGHYGDELVIMTLKVRGKESMSVFEKVVKRLSRSDIDYLLLSLEKRIDGQNLFIRLDKQALYRGEFRLSQADPVHFRFSVRGYSKTFLKDLRSLIMETAFKG